MLNSEEILIKILCNLDYSESVQILMRTSIKKIIMCNKKIFFSICILSICLTNVGYCQNQPEFKVVKKLAVSGDGGWDYLTVDPPNKQLYVSHGNEVNILNLETGKEIGKVINTTGVHGIVLLNNLGKGYTSNGKDNSCTVFDLKTNAELKKIRTGANPDAIFYDNFSEKIFVFNGKSGDATVIDPYTDKVLATIPLGGKPETGVSDDKGQIFVNIETTNEVVVFDAKTYKIIHRYKIDKGDEPSGLAIDFVTNRLFIGCGGNQTLVVMDALSGKNIADFPIGDCDGVVFDPLYKTAYASNREGNISVIKEIDANNFKQLKSIDSEFGARTIAIDLNTHRLYTSAAQTTPAVATPENPKARPNIVSDTFHVLEIGE
jgi:YVTN family beta-propeller protein